MLQDMIGDLTSSPEPIEIKLFSADPELLKKWGPKVGDRIKKIKGRGGCEERNREHHQRTGDRDEGGSGGGRARSGFTPQEIELDASAILQGEPAATPVVVNDRAYTIRVRFPKDTRASLDQIRNTDDHQQLDREDRDARFAGGVSRRKWGRRRFAARICSGVSRLPAGLRA